jgi:hypothetical protein
VKYLIFLDIDGVFTSARVHSAQNADYDLWHKFDPIAVDFMNKIHDTHTVEFVLITTWKDHLRVDNTMIPHWIKAAFANSGFRGKFHNMWKTDPDNLGVNKPRPYDRSHEIRDFMEEYGTDVEDFIIFDDNDFNFKSVLGKSRLVRTDADNGLLHKHMLNALSMMGSWKKK